MSANQPSTLDVVTTGIAFGESPLWPDHSLWLSDWGAGEILSVDATGKTEVVARSSSLPFSIDWLPCGEMLVTAGRRDELLRLEADGSLEVHSSLAGLGSGWNEIAIDGRGNTYINAACFDLMGGGAFRPGVIVLVKPDGTAQGVATEVAFPNGMVITPDNRTLILAESYAKKLTAFTIADDGCLSERRVWAELGDGVPDGLCLDADGAVWYADVPHKRCVRVLEGGAVLNTVDVDRGCFSCVLGGTDRRTLYIIATEWNGPSSMTQSPRTGRVLSIEAPAPATGWP
jgi:sugar lactone lactonase YvrE